MTRHGVEGTGRNHIAEARRSHLHYILFTVEDHQRGREETGMDSYVENRQAWGWCQENRRKTAEGTSVVIQVRAPQ